MAVAAAPAPRGAPSRRTSGCRRATRRGGVLGLRALAAELSYVQRIDSTVPFGRSSGAASWYTACQFKSQSGIRISERVVPSGQPCGAFDDLAQVVGVRIEPQHLHVDRQLQFVASP